MCGQPGLWIRRSGKYVFYGNTLWERFTHYWPQSGLQTVVSERRTDSHPCRNVKGKESSQRHSATVRPYESGERPTVTLYVSWGDDKGFLNKRNWTSLRWTGSQTNIPSHKLPLGQVSVSPLDLPLNVPLCIGQESW